MIRVARGENGRVDVEAVLERPPAIYLDQDSLSDIARTAARRQRFLDLWRRRGELLFSWTNAFDLSGPQGGTAERIKELLRDVGPNWVPIEMNPYQVARKEAGEEPFEGVPCFSETLLRSLLESRWEDMANLGHVVDLVQHDRGGTRLEVEAIKTAVHRMIRTYRSQHSGDPSWLDRTLPHEPNDRARPTTFLLRELERLMTTEGRAFSWTPNDGVDFMHAAVAGGYADLLALDRHWKRRVLAAAPQRAYPWVFYRRELDVLLDAIEAWEMPD